MSEYYDYIPEIKELLSNIEEIGDGRYIDIKDMGDGRYTRRTKEVYIEARIDDKHIYITGEGDFNHHLIEDTIILLKKILGGHENL